MYAHVCTYHIKYVKTKLIQAFMHALATLQDWRMKVLEWQNFFHCKSMCFPDTQGWLTPQSHVGSR